MWRSRNGRVCQDVTQGDLRDLVSGKGPPALAEFLVGFETFGAKDPALPGK